ncbi:MAG: hypothetical protein EOP07_11130 [Proteobacteria bacterium]|nr:MAG: hypothetical protein EOP07_11130 [Pseudomonadota bacterium]
MTIRSHWKKTRNALIVGTVILGGNLAPSNLLAAESSKTAAIDLEIKKTWSIPLREISALSLFDKNLYLASDNERDFLRLPIDGGDFKTMEVSQSKSLSLKAPKGMKLSKKSQWEGLAIDKAGTMFAVKESKDQIFQFTNDGLATRLYQLQYFDGRKNKRKGYEGLLLMKNSHVLIALTAPPTLIEYGPKGEKALGVNHETLLLKDSAFTPPSSDDLYPLASWTLESPKGCETSDLTLSSLGSVLVLLKDCFHIVRAPNLDPSKKSFTPEQVWNYPSEIDHAEGLVEMNDAFLISVDQMSDSRNLFWVEAKTKEPKKAP